MSTTQIGREAEQVVAQTLQKQGYEILAQNWRTRWCEIDIVAKRHKRVYFVEVKYRKVGTWGDGLDAITPKKLQQMMFAAELWVSEHNWQNDTVLLVASASGSPPRVDELIEL